MHLSFVRHFGMPPAWARRLAALCSVAGYGGLILAIPAEARGALSTLTLLPTILCAAETGPYGGLACALALFAWDLAVLPDYTLTPNGLLGNLALLPAAAGVSWLRAREIRAWEQAQQLRALQERGTERARQAEQLAATLAQELATQAGSTMERARVEQRRWEAEVARARMDGALLIARTAAHEVNNALSPVAGFAELLTMHPVISREADASMYAQIIREAAAQAAEKIHQLQSIVRLEEVPSALGPDQPLLDLDRSSAPT